MMWLLESFRTEEGKLIEVYETSSGELFEEEVEEEEGE